MLRSNRAAGVLVALSLGLALSGCGGSGSAAGDQSKEVSKDSFASWPLTVDKGTLKCVGAGGVGKVTITVNGTTYALNGTAKGSGDHKDIDPIWAPAETAGLKKDIGPLIAEGLKLCK